VSSTVTVPGLVVPVTHEAEPNACYDYFGNDMCGRPWRLLYDLPSTSRYHVQRFVLLGDVGPNDDENNRLHPDYSRMLQLTWNNGAITDFCEDLILLNDYFDDLYCIYGAPATPVLRACPATATVHAILTWDGPANLNMYVVRNSQGRWSGYGSGVLSTGNREELTATVDAASYTTDELICVTYYDPQPVVATPVPYRLEVEIVR
jgi:hypothetical protein